MFHRWKLPIQLPWSGHVSSLVRTRAFFIMEITCRSDMVRTARSSLVRTRAKSDMEIPCRGVDMVRTLDLHGPDDLCFRKDILATDFPRTCSCGPDLTVPWSGRAPFGSSDFPCSSVYLKGLLDTEIFNNSTVNSSIFQRRIFPLKCSEVCCCCATN